MSAVGKRCSGGRVGQGPGIRLDPGAAVVQMTGPGARAAAAAHQEQPHLARARARFALEPAREIGQPAGQPVRIHLSVEHRLRPEIHITDHPLGAVAVGPAAHDQFQRPFGVAVQPGEILQRGLHIDIVPAGHEQDRHAGETVVVSRRPDAGAFPEIVKGAVLPLVQQIAFVVGVPADGRAAARPGGLAHPAEKILGLDGVQDLGAFARQRAFQRAVVGPGRLLHLQRAALADAAGEGVGKAAGIDDHTGKARRVEAGQRDLHMRVIAEAHGADAAVAPALRVDPGHRVIAVFGLVHVFGEAAFRAVAPPAILPDHDIAFGHQPQGKILAAHRAGVRHRKLGARGSVLVIGGAFKHHGKRRFGKLPALHRPVDVGGKPGAVAHRHHDVAVHGHIGPQAFGGCQGGHHCHFTEVTSWGRVSSARPPTMLRVSFEAQWTSCQ
jgi:hypothetical protein